VKIYVEGGGDGGNLRDRCRCAFAQFAKRLFKDTELSAKNPQFVACGSRNEAFDRFCTAIKHNEPCLLLIDSEAPVSTKSPWLHLQSRSNDTNWRKPENAEEDQCHLMVQCMEAWFIADKNAIEQYYGKDFHSNRLPDSTDIEKIDKQQLLDALENASRDTIKGRYGKGKHSFGILAEIDPKKVELASRWAKRFFDVLRERMKNS